MRWEAGFFYMDLCNYNVRQKFMRQSILNSVVRL